MNCFPSRENTMVVPSDKLGDDYVMFGDVPGTQDKEPIIAAYRIKSEKEVRKK